MICFERISESGYFDEEVYSNCNKIEVLNYQEKMKKLGFTLDYEHDIYVKTGLGALVFFCGNSMNLADVIEKCYLENNSEYLKFIRKLIKEDYKLIFRKVGDSYAAFCSNYLDIINKQNNNQFRKTNKKS